MEFKVSLFLVRSRLRHSFLIIRISMNFLETPAPNKYQPASSQISAMKQGPGGAVCTCMEGL